MPAYAIKCSFSVDILHNISEKLHCLIYFKMFIFILNPLKDKDFKTVLHIIYVPVPMFSNVEIPHSLK